MLCKSVKLPLIVGAYFASADVHLSVHLGNDTAAAHPAFLFLGC